jgi:two-component system sensor histidine kinase/response regulator
MQVEERTAQLEREIVEREREEQRIQLLGQIAQQMKDAVILTDADAESRIRYVNDAFSTIYGYSKDEVLGQSSKSLFAGDAEELDRLSKARREGISRQGECRLEYQDRRKDGSAFWVSNTLSIICLGETRYDLGIIRDITQRKQAEERLLRRNRELALLNQVSQELTATLDRQQVAEHSLKAATEIINAGGASIWTWDEEQEGWLVCRYACGQGQARSPVNLRLPPGQGIASWVAQSGEGALVTSTQDDRRFFRDIDEQIGFHTSSLLAVPLKVRGSVVGVLEVVNKLQGDFGIDDQVMAETLAASVAVAIDNARLIEALRQRTIQLEARNEELAAFGHTAAHDLKNPLARIVGLAEVLKEDQGDISSKELRRYLHQISQTGRKMSSIIDDLLLLAGIRQMDVEMQALDTASIVAQAHQRLAAMIEEYQADIILPDTWPVAMGYAPWIEEVWVNCLSNAIKYGGHPPRVELGAQVQPDGMVGFWIRDNGLGIPQDAQARLFIPFTRLDQVRAEGHGLGLSIVQRIVERFGGQIWVESETGQGSTFIFTLPCIQENST